MLQPARQNVSVEDIARDHPPERPECPRDHPQRDSRPDTPESSEAQKQIAIVRTGAATLRPAANRREEQRHRSRKHHASKSALSSSKIEGRAGDAVGDRDLVDRRHRGELQEDNRHQGAAERRRPRSRSRRLTQHRVRIAPFFTRGHGERVREDGVNAGDGDEIRRICRRPS